MLVEVTKSVYDYNTNTILYKQTGQPRKYRQKLRHWFLSLDRRTNEF